MTENDLREFLLWFKDAKEKQWATWDTRLVVGTHKDDGSPSDWDWQQGTRLVPMSEAEISATEQRWAMNFPWDYRLFLSICGVPDRPALRLASVENGYKTVEEVYKFMNWRGSESEIADRLNWPIVGLFGDGRRPYWWQDKWGSWQGEVPRWEEARLILNATRSAPQLIPVFGHRMLLPMPSGASVYLSVMRGDIIVYAYDLRLGLLADNCGFLEEIPARWKFEVVQPDMSSQPFWGDIIG